MVKDLTVWFFGSQSWLIKLFVIILQAMWQNQNVALHNDHSLKWKSRHQSQICLLNKLTKRKGVLKYISALLAITHLTCTCGSLLNIICTYMSLAICTCHDIYNQQCIVVRSQPILDSSFCSRCDPMWAILNFWQICWQPNM